MSNDEVMKLFSKKSKVKILIKLTVVWVANSKFGVSWKAEQIKVSKPKILDRYAFDDDSDDEEDEPDEDDGDGNSSSDEEEVVNK